jgi:hypothetical protein
MGCWKCFLRERSNKTQTNLSFDLSEFLIYVRFRSDSDRIMFQSKCDFIDTLKILFAP